MFRPGDMAQGFVIVLSGRIEVRLTSASGREILLYAVEPGESCVQTTLGLMGGEPYSGEAVAATDASEMAFDLMQAGKQRRGIKLRRHYSRGIGKAAR